MEVTPVCEFFIPSFKHIPETNLAERMYVYPGFPVIYRPEPLYDVVIPGYVTRGASSMDI